MIDVADMAAAREERAALQVRMIRKYESPVVAVCLNLAGPRKRSTLSDAFFSLVVEEVESVLNLHRISVHEKVILDRPTGLYAVFSVASDAADAADIKRHLIRLEHEHEAYRVVDLDVLDVAGHQVSRQALGEPARTCWLCGEPAQVCARNRTHTIEELWSRAHLLIYAFLFDHLRDRVRTAALTGLLYEVMTAPKPGLVDRLNSGAHTDMNLFTFVDSTLSFHQFIDDVLLLGCDLKYSEEQLFEALRKCGLIAERAMLKATGGINTQKGLVFALSLLVGAYGCLWMTHVEKCFKEEGTRNEIVGPALSPTEEEWRDLVARIARYALRDFERDYFSGTEGRELYLKHKIAGARGEAAAGYPTVFTIGLPRLKQALDIFDDREYAGVFALLHIMLHAEDTNMIADAGVEQCQAWREEISALLTAVEAAHADAGAPAAAEVLTDGVSRIDRQFIADDISPGGSADILALTWFVYRLLYEKGHRDYRAHR